MRLGNTLRIHGLKKWAQSRRDHLSIPLHINGDPSIIKTGHRTSPTRYFLHFLHAIPSGSFPVVNVVVTSSVFKSTTAKSPLPKSEISTSLPSGVNFNRFECFVFTSTVCVTFFDATSIIDTVPSPEFAAHTSFSSGEISIPSGPLPTFTFVPVQSVIDFFISSTDTVFDSTLLTYIVRPSFVNTSMCGRFCPS